MRRRLGLPGPPKRVVESPVTTRLRRVFAGQERLYCVQIGSNDGLQGDPLNALFREQPGWGALFVEPVPSLFARLRNNYPDASRFRAANVAVSGVRGTLSFYTVSERAREAFGDSLPYWFDQLGSFNREHILRHLDGRLEPYIVEIEVPAMTLDDLLREHSVDQVDLLHSDTEGHDLVVLQGLDFSRFRPRAILYEHKHLSVDDQRRARELVSGQGYELHEYQGDTLALRTESPAVRSANPGRSS